jgi:hypothetical protein
MEIRVLGATCPITRLYSQVTVPLRHSTSCVSRADNPLELPPVGGVAGYNSIEMPSVLSRIGENGIAFVLLLLAAIGAAVSPFNTFLRSKYFSDGYRWRGLNLQDSIPILKTLGFTVAFAAGSAGVILKSGATSLLCYGVFVGMFTTIVVFSVWHSLRKARRARESRN